MKKPPHTFQKWDSIKTGLSIILPKNEVNKVSKLTTNPPKFQVSKLKELNDLRNNVVHHFDRDYKRQSERNDFIRDIKKDIELIEIVIDSIHEIVSKYEENEANK